MPEILTKVLAVTEHTAKTGKKYHKIALEDGHEYATFKPTNAQIASTLVGQPAYADVSVKTEGDFTNYNLWAIRAGEGATPHSPSIVEAAPKEQASRGTMDQDTVERITRLSCLSSACALHAGISGTPESISLDAILSTAEKFYHYAFNGR